MISGILPVDKPAGWTSHDVVARVRRLAGQKQVGHAGTLDPLATGVLLLVLGDATRLASYLMDTSKVYCAEVVLGVTTATDDAEAALGTKTDTSNLSAAHVRGCLAAFCGTLQQVPPAYAAVRHDGRKLYALAREGVVVRAKARTVVVHSIDLVRWAPPRIRLRVHCESGTYIRSLARDLGAAVGVGGYLHALRRTRSGSFTASECYTMDELLAAGDLARCLQPLDRAVLDLPAAVLTEGEAGFVRTGRAVVLGGAAAGTVRLYGPTGIFIGLGTADRGAIKPFRVFAGAERGDARRQSV